jgi:hypothetical protein
MFHDERCHELSRDKQAKNLNWLIRDVDEEKRLDKFLQEDHVRLYGRDLCQRIEQAGFECEVLSTADMSPDEQRLYALRHPVFQEVFLCRRPLHA